MCIILKRGGQHITTVEEKAFNYKKGNLGRKKTFDMKLYFTVKR